MTLDEMIKWWKAASDKASSKELGLLAFGIYAGLRMAQDESLTPTKDSGKFPHTGGE